MTRWARAEDCSFWISGLLVREVEDECCVVKAGVRNFVFWDSKFWIESSGLRVPSAFQLIE